MKPIVPVVIVIALVASAAVLFSACEAGKVNPIISTQPYKVCDVATHAAHTTAGVVYDTPHLNLGDSIEIGAVGAVGANTEVTFPDRTLAMGRVAADMLTTDVEYPHRPPGAATESAPAVLEHRIDLVALGFVPRARGDCKGGNRIRIRFCVLEKETTAGCDADPIEGRITQHLGDVHAEN